jgi:NAD(P)-dependent dehydrogenase (short-subunit alcohol dehydrogenase family)
MAEARSRYNCEGKHPTRQEPAMEINVPGMRVLVTGGGAGIGRKIAETFASSGARVHVCDVDTAALADFSAANPGAGTTVCDIADRAAVDRLFDDIAARMDGLDVLVNNASISGPVGRVEDLDIDEWERVFAVNTHGTFYCTRRAIPMLKRAGEGSIINISSVSGRLPYPMRSPYSTSKFAMVGFTQCLALELGAYDIRANAILPGIVRGERWFRNAKRRAAAAGVSVDEIIAGGLARVATGNMIEPEEIADTAVFLASRLGRNITGQSISVCGYVQALSNPLPRAE